MINLKSKIIVMSKRKYLTIISFALILVSLGTVLFDNNSVSMVSTGTENFNTNYIIHDNSILQNDCQQEPSPVTLPTSSPPTNKLEVKEIEGTEVIGKLEIPKIDLTTYILVETNKETLNKSVTKLCGPKANGVGNLCVTGHNYHKDLMFGDLKKVELNDKIYVTGLNGNKVEYIVYDMYTVYPKEVECLSQETEGERQITLITCTTGAIKRLVVKAVEVYD